MYHDQLARDPSIHAGKVRSASPLAGQVAEQMRHPDITQQTQKLGMAIMGLSERLEVLAGRLGPVLTPPVPATAQNEIRGGAATDLGQHLLGHSDRIEQMEAQVADLIQRLGV